MRERRERKCIYCESLFTKPPVDLYLISEKFIWKHYVRQLDFQSISNLIFTACVACRLKMQFVELGFFNLIFQSSSTDQQRDRYIFCTNKKILHTMPCCLASQSNSPFWIDT